MTNVEVTDTSLMVDGQIAIPEAEHDALTTENEFSYQRQDGTIETARSIEEVIEKCPVLGKMSLEQASVLLDLASIGNARLKAESVSKQIDEKVVSDKKHEDSKEADSVEIKQSVLRADPENTIPLREVEVYVQNNQEAIVELATETPTHLRKRVTPEYHHNLAQTSKIKAKEVVVSANTADKQAEATNESMLPYTNSKIIESQSVQNKTSDETREIISQNSEEADIPASSEQIEAVALPVDIDIETAAEDSVSELVPQDLSEAISEVVEVFSEEAVQNTYDELIVITERSEQQVTESAELVGESFQELVELQIEPAQPTSLEAIKSLVDEQPVIETLIQVAYFIETGTEDIEKKVVIDLLQEIHEATYGRLQDESGEPLNKPVLTPEITGKLLSLFRAIGYENPQETLTEFVKTHGIEYLMQAISYMYQIANQDNHQEFLIHAPAGSSTYMSTKLAMRIGKGILTLMKSTLSPLPVRI
jgi:hypothetical protein